MPDHRPDPESCAIAFGKKHACLLDPDHEPPHICACGKRSDGTPPIAVPEEDVSA